MTHGRVELRPAFAWDCDECGEENFERAIIKEKPPGETINVTFVMVPDVVKCWECEREFEAVDFGEDE